jgi:predicted GH43/DUF377 family glycosyl hydrolase
MSVFRWPNNPIITPKDVKPSRSDFEVVGAFNAGVARLDDEVVLLLRVAERPISRHPDIELTAFYDTATGEISLKEFSKNDATVNFSDPRFVKTAKGKYLTSISHLRVARSRDGVNFDIDSRTAVSAANDYEAFGVEDPRISMVDEKYYITYVGVSAIGLTTCLMSTKDFVDFVRHGVIFCPDNKNVTLFGGKIGGKYYALHRPVSMLFEKYEIWIAESPDLRYWGNHKYLMGARQGLWDARKIGGGAPPFLTEQGWLTVYHGADESNRYCLGAVLLDAEEPWKVIARTTKPILEPEADYEVEGFFGNVVFTCGLLYEEKKVRIYYGVSDSSIAYAEISLEEILDNLTRQKY